MKYTDSELVATFENDIDPRKLKKIIKKEDHRNKTLERKQLRKAMSDLRHMDMDEWTYAKSRRK